MNGERFDATDLCFASPSVHYAGLLPLPDVLVQDSLILGVLLLAGF